MQNFKYTIPVGEGANLKQGFDIPIILMLKKVWSNKSNRKNQCRTLQYCSIPVLAEVITG